MTKQYRGAKWIFWFLSFLCNFGLVIAFFIYGMATATEITRYSMCLAGIVGMIVALTSTILKRHWRTPLVIMLGTMYFVAQNFAIVLITIGVAIMLDELFFTPAYKHFKNKAMINHEIDKREVI